MWQNHSMILFQCWCHLIFFQIRISWSTVLCWRTTLCKQDLLIILVASKFKFCSEMKRRGLKIDDGTPIIFGGNVRWVFQTQGPFKNYVILLGGRGRDGKKISDLPKLSRYQLSETGIRKFFCQNEISFDPYPKETKLLASFVTYLEGLT